jgi:hypothetical protein
VGPYVISAHISDNLRFVDADLHYRVNGGSVTSVQMQHTDTFTYTGSIPGQFLGSTIEFYIRAEDAKGNAATDPPGAPSSWRSLFVEVPVVVLNDDVEADRGWSLGLAGDTATDGRWERGNPQGTTEAGQPAQPEDDHTSGGGVNCFATELAAGSSARTNDVDGGCTTLLSPRVLLEAGSDARVTYWRWYYDETPSDDEMVVSVSNDDGVTWVPIETVSATANSWTRASISLCGILPLTNEMRVRFVACDTGAASTTEAAVDDVRFERFQGDVVDVADNTVITGPRTAIETINPNPFNPLTTITYTLSTRGDVALRVFDIHGREVRQLVTGFQSPGRYSLSWDGKDDAGHELSTGVYFVRLDAGGEAIHRQVTLLK